MKAKLNWKSVLSGVALCSSLVGCAPSGPGVAGSVDFYEGQFTAVAGPAEAARVVSRDDALTMVVNSGDVTAVSTFPDLCDLQAKRDSEGVLRLLEGTQCAPLGLMEREGTFMVVVEKQDLVERDNLLIVSVHGTIHENDASAPSEGDFDLFYVGTYKAPSEE